MEPATARAIIGAVTRVDFDPEQTDPLAFYRLLNSVVIPRPIAWVSSRSAEGVDNLAPHSFFTVACTDPPIVQFTSVGRKDSLRNVEATREFVVNFTPEPLFEAVNATSVNAPPDVSELDHVGIAREPSLRVAPPRVAASPVAIECVLHDTLPLGDCTVVLGRVVHMAIAADAMRDGRPAADLLRPLARLGGRQWSTLGELLEIDRPRWEERALSDRDATA
ncbi:MAG TPA: flavin reductase family protein [Conexibacter sp.]|nr:flavin reductase family protein [Conexibacter sp.]